MTPLKPLRMTIVTAIAVATAASSLGLGWVATRPAAAATLTWDITFTDSAGGVVGSGEFSYDDALLTFVQTSFGSSTDGFWVQNALTNFAATVLGVAWDFRDRPGVTWWHPTQPNSLGQQRITRSGIFISDSWFFGDPFFGVRQLLLTGGSQGNNRWGGTWSEAVQNPITLPTLGAGFWEATPSHQTAVPEPATVLGSALFGLGCLIGKTLTANKKPPSQE